MTISVSTSDFLTGHEALKALAARDCTDPKVVYATAKTLSAHNRARTALDKAVDGLVKRHCEVDDKGNVVLEPISEGQSRAKFKEGGKEAYETDYKALVESQIDVDIHAVSLSALLSSVAGIKPAMIAALSYWYADDME